MVDTGNRGVHGEAMGVMWLGNNQQKSVTQNQDSSIFLLNIIFVTVLAVRLLN